MENQTGNNNHEPSKDPSNWKWGIFYVNGQDNRMIVPKRVAAFGWTLNFGNPKTGVFLIGVFVAMLIGVAIRDFLNLSY